MKKLIFMGTPDFARTILRGLIDSQDYEIVAVVTQPDRPVGRKRTITPSPVKEEALAHDLPIFQPERLKGSEEESHLLKLGADLIITAAYGQFLSKDLLDLPKYGAINVHASLLPKYRGGAPIHYAIWRGESKTGISIIYMEEGMDTGDIISQAMIPIRPEDTVGVLFDKLADLGRNLLLQTLPQLFAGEIEAEPQDPSRVSYSPTIKKEEEELDWTETAQVIDCQVRAFNPFPSSHTYYQGKRTKIWQGRVVDFNPKEPSSPGTIVSLDSQQMIIQAGGNTYYAITEIQPNGKKRMPVAAYLNGVDSKSLLGTSFTRKEDSHES